MRLLSEEFFAHPAHRRLPVLAGGFDGRIRWVVDGAPDGKVRVRTAFEGGRLVEVVEANDRDAELTLTIRHGDLVALLAGEADLNALFMAGDLKTDGPTGPLLDLIVAVDSAEGRAVRDELNGALTGS